MTTQRVAVAGILGARSTGPKGFFQAVQQVKAVSKYHGEFDFERRQTRDKEHNQNNEVRNRGEYKRIHNAEN